MTIALEYIVSLTAIMLLRCVYQKGSRVQSEHRPFDEQTD